MRYIGAKNVLHSRLMEVVLKQPTLKDLIRKYQSQESLKLVALLFEISTFLLPYLECASVHTMSLVYHCAK